VGGCRWHSRDAEGGGEGYTDNILLSHCNQWTVYEGIIMMVYYRALYFTILRFNLVDITLYLVFTNLRTYVQRSMTKPAKKSYQIIP